MLDDATFEKYQRILAKDPKSKLFAPLAEAYRERGLLEAAEQLAREGTQFNPEYVGGYTVLARILQESNRAQESLSVLEQALKLSPENLLAYQLLAEAHTQMKNPELALKAHKMTLFLNPLHEKSRKAIEKLETLTANQYDEELFQYQELTTLKKLPELAANPTSNEKKASAEMASATLPAQAAADFAMPEIEQSETAARALALIDVWIVRNDIPKARQILEEARKLFPYHPEINKRMKILGVQEEKPELIQPLPRREKIVIQKKIQMLNRILTALPSFSRLTDMTQTL